jgi:hypothetical protein
MDERNVKIIKEKKNEAKAKKKKKKKFHPQSKKFH